MIRLAPVLAILVVTAACKDNPRKTGGESTSTAAAGPVIKLTVDEAPAPPIAAPKKPATLASLLPKTLADPSRLYLVTAKGGARSLYIPEMAKTYPNHELRLYPGADGKPNIGLFALGNKASPRPTLELARVDQLIITSQKPKKTRGRDDQQPPLTIRLGDQTHTMPLEQLKTPPEPLAEGRSARDGWLLGEVLAQAKVEAWSSAVLVSPGKSMTVDRADLEKSGDLLFIRLNQKGQIRVKRFRPRVGKGRPKKLVDDLRYLQRIDVTP